jgi:predicted SnoaL-like aldol condensation-catalyzing enzyme
MAFNKETALNFLQLVTAGKITEAYEKYVDVNGKHHNMYFAAGFPALQKAMQENEVLYPGKTISVKHVLGDGDMVAVHSHVKLQPGELEIAVVHLFRFADGKIFEMWDIGAQISMECPNGDGVF